MKSILASAALLVSLAGPALADDAATQTTTPQAQQPAAVQILPAALPQSPAQPAEELSKSVPEDGQAEAMSPMGNGGCHHAKQTVYLTN